jgi:transcriptional regulator with PAS, ATPase and Fis domain
MSKSTEQELSELHGAVAKVLRRQIEEEITVTDEEGNTQLLNTASPATLGVAIKFLKDNNITASIEDDENLGELDELLKAKREKGSLRLVSGDAE